MLNSNLSKAVGFNLEYWSSLYVGISLSAKPMCENKRTNLHYISNKKANTHPRLNGK